MKFTELTEQELAAKRNKNNPGNKPTGHFTGRCKHCGSDDLWDDNLAYGCNDCGAFWCGIEPVLIPNGWR